MVSRFVNLHAGSFGSVSSQRQTFFFCGHMRRGKILLISAKFFPASLSSAASRLFSTCESNAVSPCLGMSSQRVGGVSRRRARAVDFSSCVIRSRPIRNTSRISSMPNGRSRDAQRKKLSPRVMPSGVTALTYGFSDRNAALSGVIVRPSG